MNEVMQGVRIMVDLDGVLGDFNQHVSNQFGVHPDQISDERLWALIATVEDFWLTMPLAPSAHALWQFLQPYDPIILTGCPKSAYDQAAAQKVAWAKQQFGETVQIITCLSREKAQYLISQGDILIDDFGGHVKRWRKAGGRAVRYRNFQQTMTDLRKLLDDEGPD